MVNIKPPRLGGILPAIAVHDLCTARQVPAWCGGMLETGIGRGFNLALAALPGFTLHSDMSPARMFYARDLVDPTFDIRPDGTIAVPDRPGNGFPVDARASSRTPLSAAGKATGGTRPAHQCPAAPTCRAATTSR